MGGVVGSALVGLLAVGGAVGMGGTVGMGGAVGSVWMGLLAVYGWGC